MICKKPFVKSGRAFGCGQCLPCRVNRSRKWTHRLMLERTQHSQSCFATLTYNDASIPNSSGQSICSTKNLRDCTPSLYPGHLQAFMKRLRKAMEPEPIRFFAVGEYGDETWRPHYHVALFGYPSCVSYQTRRVPGSIHPLGSECCAACAALQKAWGMGDIQLAELNQKTMRYISRYVVKKLTGGMADLYGPRQPEFIRMSNRPGIGYDAMHEVANTILSTPSFDSGCDVPHQLRHGSNLLPLDRYLRDALRLMTGRAKGLPKGEEVRLEAELLELREVAFNSSRSFSSVLSEASEGARASLAARREIYKQRSRI